MTETPGKSKKSPPLSKKIILFSLFLYFPLISKSKPHSKFLQKAKKINFPKRSTSQKSNASNAPKPELHSKLISQNVASDLELIENQIENSLQSLKSEPLPKNPKSNPENIFLQNQVKALKQENSDLKRKEITRNMRDDLRMQAQNLLVKADGESREEKKHKLLEEATKIIGMRFFYLVFLRAGRANIEEKLEKHSKIKQFLELSEAQIGDLAQKYAKKKKKLKVLSEQNYYDDYDYQDQPNYFDDTVAPDFSSGENAFESNSSPLPQYSEGDQII